MTAGGGDRGDLTERTVEAVLGTAFEDLRAEAVHDLRRRFVDVVGCAVGGARADGNDAFRRVMAGRTGPGGATVLRGGQRLPAAEAAMLNAVQARSYDFEVSEIHCRQDEDRPTGHIPATVDLAALAVGEAVGATGREVLTAAAVGGDLAARLATAEDFAPARSFDLSGTVTTFGAAAAAARLLGLDGAQLRHALGLCLQTAAGSFQAVWDGVHAFRLPQGCAARSGIEAAELARVGVTGPTDPLFGRRGYFAQYTRGHDPDCFSRELGRTLHTAGYHKAYPACYGSHPVVEACLEIAGEDGLDPDRVEAVEIELWADRLDNFIARPLRPEDPPQRALFSIPYAAASTLLRGRAVPADWDPEAVADPAVLRMAGAVSLAPTLPDDWGHGAAARVHVRLDDGSVRSEGVERPRGFPGREPDDDALTDKFRLNLDHAGDVPADRAREALRLLWTLDRVEDVAAIPRLLVGGGDGRG